jgi:hypothetical protein
MKVLIAHIRMHLIGQNELKAICWIPQTVFDLDDYGLKFRPSRYRRSRGADYEERKKFVSEV